MLTRYKLVGTQGIGSLRTPQRVYQLDQLTDDDCDILVALGQASPYIEKLEIAPEEPEQEVSNPPAADPEPETLKEPAPAKRIKRNTNQ